MDYNTTSILCVSLMLFLLVIGVSIAYSLGFSSILIGYLAFGSFALQKAGGLGCFIDGITIMMRQYRYFSPLLKI